jgi:hypothetical protein
MIMISPNLAARKLGLTDVGSIRRWIRAGLIAAWGVDGHQRIPLDEFNRLISVRRLRDAKIAPNQG